MALANAINATQTGIQSQTSSGVWNGRTITAGAGISIENGDGISGNPTISATASAGGYALSLLMSSSNPNDATTYYIATNNVNVSAATAASKLFIPQTGVITKFLGSFTVAGTLGTNENCTLNIFLNGTSTTLISSTFNLSSAVTDVSNTSLSISVSQGDYIQFQFITPTWATNPTAVSFSGVIYIES